MSNTPCWLPLSLESSLSPGTKVSMVLQKKKKTHKSKSHWVPIQKQLRVWQLVLGSQHANEDTQLPKKTAQILRLSRGRRCFCSLAKYKIIITAEMPDMKNVSLRTNGFRNWRNPGTKKGTKYARDRHNTGRNPMLPSEDHTRISSRRRRKSHAKELYQNGLAKYGTVKQRWVPGGFEGNEGRQEPWQEVQVSHAFQASQRRNLRCGHGGRAEGELEVLPNPQRLRHLLQRDHQGVHRKCQSHQGPRRDIRQIRGAVAHIPLKISLTTTLWEKTKSTSMAKVLGKIPCWRQLFARANNTLHKQSGDSPQTKRPWTSQQKWNFEQNETLKKKVHGQCCNMTPVASTTFGACGVKQPNLSQEQEEQAQTSLQEGFAYIQALLQLEIRPRRLRCNICWQSKALQQYGKAKDHDQKAVTVQVRFDLDPV